MTDFYVKGYRIILVTLRGGRRVAVVRSKGDNKYLFHLDNTERFDEWLDWLRKEPSCEKDRS